MTNIVCVMFYFVDVLTYIKMNVFYVLSMSSCNSSVSLRWGNIGPQLSTVYRMVWFVAKLSVDNSLKNFSI